MQTQLRINEPGDQYEQEADRVAEQVMRMPDAGVTKEGRDTEPPLVQRQATSGDTGMMEAPPSVHDVLNSPGQPLDAATRAFFEPRFGHDFSRVRVHAGNRAAQSAREMNASAYTVGSDIVFGASQSSPTHESGRQLLAHELTHVLQEQAAVEQPLSTTRGALPVMRQEVGDKSSADSLKQEKKKKKSSADDVMPADPLCPELEQIRSMLPPKDEQMWCRELPFNYPRLQGKCIRVIRERSDNCLGYCLAQANGAATFAQGTDIAMVGTIEEFDKMFEPFYEPIALEAIDAANVPGDAILALYGDVESLKHVACRSDLGHEGRYLWQSKLSPAFPLILHHLEDVEGGAAGDVIRLYRRRAQPPR